MSLRQIQIYLFGVPQTQRKTVLRSASSIATAYLRMLGRQGKECKLPNTDPPTSGSARKKNPLLLENSCRTHANNSVNVKLQNVTGTRPRLFFVLVKKYIKLSQIPVEVARKKYTSVCDGVF